MVAAAYWHHGVQWLSLAGHNSDAGVVLTFVRTFVQTHNLPCIPCKAAGDKCVNSNSVSVICLLCTADITDPLMHGRSITTPHGLTDFRNG